MTGGTTYAMSEQEQNRRGAPPQVPSLAWCRRRYIVIAGLVLLVVGGTAALWSHWREAHFERECDAVVAWVGTGHVLPGTYPALALPPNLSHVADFGRVHAVVLPDGRVYVVIPTKLGWHHNWEGVLRGSAPL